MPSCADSSSLSSSSSQDKLSTEGFFECLAAQRPPMQRFSGPSESSIALLAEIRRNRASQVDKILDLDSGTPFDHSSARMGRSTFRSGFCCGRRLLIHYVEECLNAQDLIGWTPLHHAAYLGHAKVRRQSSPNFSFLAQSIFSKPRARATTLILVPTRIVWLCDRFSCEFHQFSRVSRCTTPA